MVENQDYSSEIIKASHSVMLELVRLLGEYQESMRIIGGWVPWMLVSKTHVGSRDVDLVFNHQIITEDHYSSIEEILLSNGYLQGSSSYSFRRKINIEGKERLVEVDFFSGQYGGTDSNINSQQIQKGIKARKARGADLVYDMYREVKIEGILPEGGKDSATIRVAAMVPFFILKANALKGRLKNKDAYDIYFCLKNYPGGIGALVDEFLPHIDNKLLQEALEIFADKFSSMDSIGPVQVAQFTGTLNEEDKDLIKMDAFGQVNFFLNKLGFQ